MFRGPNHPHLEPRYSRLTVRLLLPALALLASPGCLSTTSPAAFCREQVEAECRKEASCQNRDDWQDCVVSRQGACEAQTEASLCGAGMKFDPARAQECVDAYATAECLGLSRGDRPASCHEVCAPL